jgi:hypothetical protein
MASETEKLRDELIGLEASIAEFQKWKLLAIGSVFAVGLGASRPTEHQPFLAALAAIPLVTVYADLLIRDYDARLCVLGAFLGTQKGAFREYENFIHGLSRRVRWYVFGNLATTLASLAANSAVLVAVLANCAKTEDMTRKLLLWTSIAGIVASALINGFAMWVNSRIFRESRQDGHQG